ncbi:MAG: biopolymer transporter Tol, partial [Ewingella sp.]|nr:biopolymer transporter Tol [Ewingella sp.]
IALSSSGVVSPKHHPREYDGSHFSVLVSHTTSDPQPDSDDITRAYEEGWIGTEGYLKPDGSRQRWALAFIGDTLSASGEKLPEVFVVDLPEDDASYRLAGELPLQGTPASLPAPPKGVRQRRITFTGQQAFPGVALQPRHWLRASPDGSKIAFLMKDNNGVVQLWTVSPNGGQAQQISRTTTGIQSAFSWHPNGKALALVCDNSVMVLDVASGEMRRLTERSEIAPCGDAVVFSPDGAKVAYMRQCGQFAQLFVAQNVG